MKLRRLILNLLTSLRFPGSHRYWELRYRLGDNSGSGSYGVEAAYKSAFLTAFVRKHDIRDIVDFGCGDGNQIETVAVDHYLGLDISRTAIERCRSRYKGDSRKQFLLASEFDGKRHECVLSLDVLYHIVEPTLFVDYLDALFTTARTWVIIYASDVDDTQLIQSRHVVRRRFSGIIADRFPDFAPIPAEPRPPELQGLGSDAAFHVWRRKHPGGEGAR